MGNSIHLAYWRGDLDLLQLYTNDKWHSPHYRKPGVFGVHPLHILVYHRNDDFCVWYDLFYHMAGEEDLNVSFGGGVTATDLTLSYAKEVVQLNSQWVKVSSPMIKKLNLFRTFLKLRHLYWVENWKVIFQESHYKLDRTFESLRRKGLSRALLPSLEPHNIHSTLYPGAPSFFTPLFVAVLANDLPFLKALISKGAKPSLQPPAPEGNYGLLHLAAHLGRHSLIHVLIKAGCPVNANAHPYEISRTPLTIAAHYGNLMCIKALAKSPGFDLQSSQGTYALFAAAQEGQFHVIPTLVKLGCKVDEYPHSNVVTPLHIAARGDHVTVVETLLKHGDNPFQVNSETALHLAAEHDSFHVIQTLLKSGLSPYEPEEMVGNQLLNPFQVACLNGSLNMLKAFTCSNYPIPCSLLHLAVCVRYYEKSNSSRPLALDLSRRISIHFIAELVEVGCSVIAIDHTSELGSLPIHYASHHNDPAVIQRLIDLGCPKNAFTRCKDGSRLTPMQVAAGSNSVEAIRVLAANGCNVDFHHPLEDPPLHVAISYGSVEAVRALLELGASVTLRNRNEFLPMHMAIVCNQIEVIEILHQHGTSVTDVPAYEQVPHLTDCQVRNRDLLGVLYKYGVRAVDDFVPYSEMSSLAEKAAHALFKHMILCTCGNSVMSPLACAVHYRNRAAARKLIELGPMLMLSQRFLK